MGSEPQRTITLDFLRDDGKHQITRLFFYSLVQARNIADSVFRRRSDAQFIEVEISTDNGYSETMSNLRPTVEDFQRI